MVHMQHPRFIAYFVLGRSYPDILAEIVTSTLAVMNAIWDISPSLTELEMAMVNWIGRAFGLPEDFLFNIDKLDCGGGVMLDGGSESILLAMLTARHKCLTESIGKINLNCRDEEHKILSKLVAYASKEAHSSAEKAAMISLVHMRPITTDENFSMRGNNLEKQIIRDIERGLRPFYIHATLGTTATCAFDNLKEIVQVAKKYNLWVHVDASYAGNSWVCPEYRYQYEGIEQANSVNVNLHKMFLNGIGSTVLFVRDSLALKKAMTVNPVYLKTRTVGTTDFRFWGVPLCRRTKALKVWFVLRMYGICGLQKYIRHMVKLANRYKDYLQKEPRLEIIGKPILGLVCFHIKSTTEEQSNKLTVGFAEYLNISRKLVVTPAKPGGIDIVRIAISHTLSSEREVDENYEIIHQLLNKYLKSSEQISVENPRFKTDPGIICSPGPSTASTPRTTGTSPGLSLQRSTRSATLVDVRNNNKYFSDTNTNSTASLNLRRDVEELKRYPELEVEKTPSNNSNSVRKWMTYFALFCFYYSKIFHGISTNYFIFGLLMMCMFCFVILYKINRNNYKNGTLASLNQRYKSLENLRILKTMTYLCFWTIIPFTLLVTYMFMINYYWKPRNYGYDYEIVSNLADLELGIASLLYPLVFAFTHPEINKKYFIFFWKMFKKNLAIKISPSLKSTIGDKQLILSNEQGAKIYFEQLKNQWK